MNCNWSDSQRLSRRWPLNPGRTQLAQPSAAGWRSCFARRARSDLDSTAGSTYLADGGLVRSERMARLEAALLVADGPVSHRKLAQIAKLIDASEVRELVATLNSAYDRERSSFRIERTAGGLVLMTRAALAPWLDRLHHRASQAKLSQPALETLTIIAYQQPITRADVESVRGVQSSEMIRQLIDRGLVRVGGEDDSLGRPFLYVTTRDFLGMYGLQSISDLPDFEALRRRRPEEDSDTEDVEESAEADADDVTDAAESESAARPAA